MGVRRLRGARVGRWLLLAACFALPAAPAAAAPALHVIPFPGTPDASPLSHIIFSSLRPSEIRSVVVVGSTSGLHTGHVIKLPDGAGSAFVPHQPFAPGEQVNVVASLTSPSAGTASGDHGATELRFSFGIAVPVTPGATADGAPQAGTAGVPLVAMSASAPPTRHFHSAPNLNPPVYTFTHNRDAGAGDVFLTPNHAPEQNGAMIVDSFGHLVWFDPTYRDLAFNLEVQSYRGHPVLTWYQADDGGEDLIMDHSYRTVAVLHGGWGEHPDVHDFQLTPRGTALVVSHVLVRTNLTSVGGSNNGVLQDGVIQELDVRTGRVLWEWHAFGHVPFTDSYARATGPGKYSYFHLNSVQELPNGNLLISARNTWALYEINKKTGRVVWRLGGRRSSFRMGAGTNFEWQHDANLIGNRLTLFDDGSRPQEERQSSAKVLRLDLHSMKVSLVHRYTHSPPLLAGAAGSLQILPNGNVFVGWGTTGVFSELTARGKQIFTGSLPLGVYSYRAYRFRWTGQPATRPSVAVSAQRNGRLRVYVSWNGATQVAFWRVLGGGSPRALRPLGRFHRSGFETMMMLHSTPRYVAVQALNAGGKVLATSKADLTHHA